MSTSLEWAKLISKTSLILLAIVALTGLANNALKLQTVKFAAEIEHCSSNK